MYSDGNFLSNRTKLQSGFRSSVYSEVVKVRPQAVADLLNIVALLETKKVSLRVLSMSGSQPLDTAAATGRLMLAVIGAVGQAERETMLERQREGIAKAQREGKYKGRAPTVRRRTEEIIRLREAAVMPTEIATRLGIGRASVYRILGEQTDGERQEAA